MTTHRIPPALAAAGLTALTGLAGVATASTATAYGTGCGDTADYFSASGAHVTVRWRPGEHTLTHHTGPVWSFRPRALSHYDDLDTPVRGTRYVAISPAGDLYRVTENDNGTVSYHRFGSGWSTTRDIQVHGNRLYYVTATGEMRRRVIHADGTLSGSVLMGSGLTTTTQLSWGGYSGQWTTNGGSVSYDVIYSVTSTGALMQREYRYYASAPTPITQRITTLKTSGWNRFNSIDVGICEGGSSTDVLIMGRDWSTKEVLTYRGTWGSGLGRGLRYTGTVQSLLHPTYGA